MTPPQIQEWVKDQIQHLPGVKGRATRELKPANVTTSSWKNRHRHSVKLKPTNAQNLDEFQTLTGLNANESINFILSSFFHG